MHGRHNDGRSWASMGASLALLLLTACGGGDYPLDARPEAQAATALPARQAATSDAIAAVSMDVREGSVAEPGAAAEGPRASTDEAVRDDAPIEGEAASAPRRVDASS